MRNAWDVATSIVDLIGHAVVIHVQPRLVEEALVGLRVPRRRCFTARVDIVAARRRRKIEAHIHIERVDVRCASIQVDVRRERPWTISSQRAAARHGGGEEGAGNRNIAVEDRLIGQVVGTGDATLIQHSDLVGDVPRAVSQLRRRDKVFEVADGWDVAAGFAGLVRRTVVVRVQI